MCVDPALWDTQNYCDFIRCQKIPVRRALPAETRHFSIITRPDGHALIFRVANPTERFYKLLQEINPTVSAGNGPTIISTVKKRTPNNRLQSPEARYFLRILSESLNISRASFKDDFFARYTKSVSNAEAQITAAANHIVFGRRGGRQIEFASIRDADEGERKSTLRVA